MRPAGPCLSTWNGCRASSRCERAVDEGAAPDRAAPPCGGGGALHWSSPPRFPQFFFMFAVKELSFFHLVFGLVLWWAFPLLAELRMLATASKSTTLSACTRTARGTASRARAAPRAPALSPPGRALLRVCLLPGGRCLVRIVRLPSRGREDVFVLVVPVPVDHLACAARGA